MTTQKFNNIDVSKLSVGKIKDGTKMRTFFIDYDNKLFSVQTPQLVLDWGGHSEGRSIPPDRRRPAVCAVWQRAAAVLEDSRD